MKVRTLTLTIAAALAVTVGALAQVPKPIPRIPIDEVKALMAKHGVLLIDVRDPMSFAQGHVPGAINVPFDFLPDHAEDWKKEKRQLVTYCACVNEGTAVRAAEDMTAFGVPNVKAMLGGWNEWVKRKEKIEVSTK